LPPPPPWTLSQRRMVFKSYRLRNNVSMPSFIEIQIHFSSYPALKWTVQTNEKH